MWRQHEYAKLCLEATKLPVAHGEGKESTENRESSEVLRSGYAQMGKIDAQH